MAEGSSRPWQTDATIREIEPAGFEIGEWRLWMLSQPAFVPSVPSCGGATPAPSMPIPIEGRNENLVAVPILAKRECWWSKSKCLIAGFLPDGFKRFRTVIQKVCTTTLRVFWSTRPDSSSSHLVGVD
jgi:hypothetical protein